MKVEIWADVVCPWCYIGKRRFEVALAGFPHRAQVEVAWKAFELDPTGASAPAGTVVGPQDQARRLAQKYGTDVGSAQRMVDDVVAQAAADGLEYRLDRAIPANTVDAHQVIHLAGLRGVQDAVNERLLRAYFTEGEAVGDRDTLVRLAAEAGLDADEVRAALDEGRYVGAVRADEAEAQALGIRGVPFFVVDRKYGVSGAQPAEVLRQVLDKAWGERPALVMAGEDATACGPAAGP